MPAVFIHQENGMENLQRLVGIHGGKDPGNDAQIAVDEFAQPAVVIHRAGAAESAYEQLKFRDAERILHIHQQQRHPDVILARRPQFKPLAPFQRVVGALLVLNPPYFSHFIGLKMCRKGKIQMLHFENPRLIPVLGNLGRFGGPEQEFSQRELNPARCRRTFARMRDSSTRFFQSLRRNDLIGVILSESGMPRAGPSIDKSATRRKIYEANICDFKSNHKFQVKYTPATHSLLINSLVALVRLLVF